MEAVPASDIRVAHDWHVTENTASDGEPIRQRAVRRSFTPEYKLAVLAEYDRCTEPGEKGAILRREGLYSSLITDWRRQHRQGLRRENERLMDALSKAQVVIEVQGKVHALLDEISKSAASEE